MTGLIVVSVVVSLAVWGAVVAGLALATKPVPVRAGRPTYDLRGETPALVAFLTSRFSASENAAPATLLDLAARGVLNVEHIGPELALVRLRRNREQLNEYEQLVYDRVKSLATADGVVATGALAEGNRNLESWRKKFAHAVRNEARSKGLSEARWHKIHHTIFAGITMLPAFAGGTAFAVRDTDDPVGAFIAGAFVTYIALMFLAERLNDERATPAGAQAAAHWLGVRAQYKDLAFNEKPAAAVAIWGREFAYAAALGLAQRAVVSLPVATPPNCGQAWSDYGGMWHPVTVHYRGKGPLGRLMWGKPAHRAAQTIGIAAVISVAPVLIGSAVMSAFIGLPGDPVQLSLLVAVLFAATGLALIVSERSSQQTVRGQVIRLRRRRVNDSEYRYWIAIDDGTSRTVRAFGTTEAVWSGLAEGDLVEARAGRWLGWAESVSKVPRVSDLRP